LNVSLKPNSTAIGDGADRRRLSPGSRLATAAIRAALRCEQPDEETVGVFSNGDLDVRFSCYTEEPLPDGDWLLIGVEPDGEYLLRSFELTYKAPELTLLLLARLCGRTKFARRLGSLVHERGIGFTNCDHRPNLSPSPRPAWDQIADCFSDTVGLYPFPVM
jgi:hypothetical protein